MPSTGPLMSARPASCLQATWLPQLQPSQGMSRMMPLLTQSCERALTLSIKVQAEDIIPLYTCWSKEFLSGFYVAIDPVGACPGLLPRLEWSLNPAGLSPALPFFVASSSSAAWLIP